MAASSALVVKVRVSGVRATLAALRTLPKEASASLRVRTLELSQTLAGRVRAAGEVDGPQSALVARTVKARRDRVPVIVAGGARRVGRHRTPAGALVYATEFGMNQRSGWFAAGRYRDSTGRQFRPHLGRGSYWFFHTVEANETEIGAAWSRVADDVIREFGGAGRG